mmetsp:Transcript_11737/g.30159  ORF Transcript_11737/g.30159 Transcript_11737/m.30159 type:complete len:128 (-) Transcript_11737:37-420(-)
MTATTNTFVVNSFRNVSTDLNSAVARIASLEASLATAMATITVLSQQQAATATRVGTITSAISAAVSALPPGSPASPATTVPKIEVTPAGNLLLMGGGRDVQVEGTCGIVNPCDLLAALNGLRNVPT